MNLGAIGNWGALGLLVVLTACAPAQATVMSTSTSVPPVTPVPAQSVPDEPDATPVDPASVSPSPPPPPPPPPSPTPVPPLAAWVNGQPVYLADYERQLNQYEASLVARGGDPTSQEGQENLAWAREWILNAMIEQVLTERAATNMGVIVTDEEVDEYLQVVTEENGGPEAFQAKLAEWGETYDDAWKQVRAQLIGMQVTQRVIGDVPTVAEHVHARHILVATPEEAEHILSQIQANADFHTLAQSHSQDTSTSASGGDLGFFPRGILVAPEVEEAAFGLQPGQVSAVVASSLGYHIVQVMERDPGRPVSQENLRHLHELAVQDWIVALWVQADVQRFVETTP